MGSNSIRGHFLMTCPEADLADDVMSSSSFKLDIRLSVVCTNIDPNLITDQCNFRAKYLKNGEDN